MADEPRYAKQVRGLAAVLQHWMEQSDDFPAAYRVRDDNTDRITGVPFTSKIPPLRNPDLPPPSQAGGSGAHLRTSPFFELTPSFETAWPRCGIDRRAIDGLNTPAGRRRCRPRSSSFGRHPLQPGEYRHGARAAPDRSPPFRRDHAEGLVVGSSPVTVFLLLSALHPATPPGLPFRVSITPTGPIFRRSTHPNCSVTRPTPGSVRGPPGGPPGWCFRRRC